MDNMRVLLAGIPRGVLLEIVERDTGQRPNMQVVGHAKRTELKEAIVRHRANVVILGLDLDEFPDVCTDLLDEFPDTLVVAMAGDGRRAAVHVDNIGPGELLETIQLSKKPALVRENDVRSPGGLSGKTEE